jgi:geranylgeranyl diphosphate synthase, type II
MTGLAYRGVPEFLEGVLPAINGELDRVLPPVSTPPRRLHEAMRYSVFVGGKRLRPALCIAACAIFRPDWDAALPAAAAIELVHTYSLIHDDLPAMDDDDYRRGQLSCHRRFGEATAILTGDALLTLAFEVLAAAPGAEPATWVKLIGHLARSGGAEGGMIAGQMMDLEGEGRLVTAEELERIHRAKTGALFEASLVMGAVLGGAGPEDLDAIRGFGRAIGLAFQVKDDILDEPVGVETPRRPGDSDIGRGKTTYASLHGATASGRAVAQLTDAARRSLGRFGERGTLLSAMADYLGARAS